MELLSRQVGIVVEKAKESERWVDCVEFKTWEVAELHFARQHTSRDPELAWQNIS